MQPAIAMNDQILFIVCIAGAVTATAFVATRLLLSRPALKLRDRLSATPGTPGSGPGPSVTVKEMVQQISQIAAKPFMPTTREKQSALRRGLGHAGIYAPSAPRVIIGFKVILLAVGGIGGYAAGTALHNPMLGVSLGALLGYLAPTLWLKAQVRDNQRALNLGLPDALDLLVVCVEAGLTVDAALQRVGQELTLAHPRLSRELAIAHMETRVGLSRADALRNLGSRTSNSELQGLASMLVQAERFGTSIAQALRIHAESMRVKRQHEAEERAAKASVKLSFPLVLFIFPATFIVLAGPTVLQLLRNPAL